ncbi:MAG: mandelate racemase/muconate lactonizing enzyme family protein [Pseudomonadota bacterium]
MKIERLDVYVIKVDQHDRFGAQANKPQTLGTSSYYFESEWREAYSTQSQSCFIRIETDNGLVGWGEAQAPLVPEVAGSLVRELLGPIVLGMDPRQPEVVFDRLYHSMNVRGHTTGFMLDAMAGIDLALWDIKGRAYNAPVCEVLGGPFRTRLPAYISGIRGASTEDRVQVSRKAATAGFSGVKAYLGRGVARDEAEIRALRAGLDAATDIETDWFWKYDRSDALRLGRIADELRLTWIESPLDPEDIAGHAALAQALDTPIAVGEPLRTTRQFLDWCRQEALDIAQPDILRTGITEGKKIADIVHAHHRTIAPHSSIFLGTGTAATWHLSAAIPNFRVQEHQPPSFEITNRFVEPAMQVIDGELVVPLGPGLGVTVNEQKLASSVAQHWTVTKKA